METQFYVYAYLDPRKPGKYQYDNYVFDYEPLYIGKGKKRRAYQLSRKRDNSFLNNKLKKFSQPIIVIIKNGLSETEAFEEEKRIIAIIGRWDLKTGILANQTNGGDGASGNVQSQETIKKRIAKLIGRKQSDEVKKKLSEMFKGRPLLEETKRKISESLRGRKQSPEHIEKRIAKMRGHFVSEDTRRKIAIPQIGRVFTEEHKRKMSEAHTGIPLSEKHKKSKSIAATLWWAERKTKQCGKHCSEEC